MRWPLQVWIIGALLASTSAWILLPATAAAQGSGAESGYSRAERAELVQQLRTASEREGKVGDAVGGYGSVQQFKRWYYKQGVSYEWSQQGIDFRTDELRSPDVPNRQRNLQEALGADRRLQAAERLGAAADLADGTAWVGSKFAEHGAYSEKAWSSLAGAAAQIGVGEIPYAGSAILSGYESLTGHELREDVATGVEVMTDAPRDWVARKIDEYWDDPKKWEAIAERSRATPPPPPAQSLREQPAGAAPSTAATPERPVSPPSGSVSSEASSGRGSELPRYDTPPMPPQSFAPPRGNPRPGGSQMPVPSIGNANVGSGTFGRGPGPRQDIARPTPAPGTPARFTPPPAQPRPKTRSEICAPMYTDAIRCNWHYCMGLKCQIRK